VRRADRLFQIIQRLRGRRRAVTAAELAEELGVSDRTVYRDIRDLVATGTPIEGRTLRDYLRNIGPYAERLLD
jgi:predicted DNA-binding transcriptional regulator YafY